MFLIKYKVLLFFDDIKNQGQIKGIVYIDDLFASNSSSLIVWTRSSKLIDYSFINVNKINIKEINKEISLSFLLFILMDIERRCTTNLLGLINKNY